MPLKTVYILARFEASEGFEAFEAFEGSIRQFRASRKRKPWRATAAGFGTRKGTTSLAPEFFPLRPTAKIARHDGLDAQRQTGELWECVPTCA